MIFDFITDINSVDEMQLAVMAYNLGLTYFIYDVAKFIVGFILVSYTHLTLPFIVGFIHNKLENRRKKA